MEYDPLLTMTALNLAVVSLHKITATGDRVTLDQEYTGIINNLRIGEINADTAITTLYQEIVRVIHAGRLRDSDRAAIESEYSRQKQKGIKYLITGSLAKTFSKNPVKWLGKLAVSCVSEYFRSKVRAELQQERGHLRLNQEELKEYDALQRKLLDSLWKLLRQYQLPDSYRLTQTGLNNFYAAMQEDNPSKRLRMLKYLAGDFGMYSPYWFNRGSAAHEAGEFEDARESFGKFWEVWRPVLRKDPYKAEALKFRIDDLVGEGISESNAGEILRCLGEMRENVPLEDWANNIYIGMMYFALGHKDKAIESVMSNIDFGFEMENSGKILAKFESETPPKKFAEIPAKSPEKPVKVSEAPKPVQEVKTPEVPKPEPVKESLKQRAERGDSEAQYQLGMSCKKRGDSLEDHSDVVTLSVGLIVWGAAFYFMMSPSFWWNILIFAGSGLLGMIAGVITSIVADTIGKWYHKRANTLLTKAAENGHTEAMYLLANMIEHNRDETIRWYKNATVRGHIGAQKALSKIYKNSSEGYMWAYLAYLCGGTENLGNKPSTIIYGIYSSESVKKAEAEAQKMYDDILRRKQNTNS